ncbi:hypothetical protein [Magnetovibrio sp.]|uniref:hypothetical protein n=1 Tax=Magnetovibrio sp. TaxID=2024836 RepID=UPI002F941819
MNRLRPALMAIALLLPSVSAGAAELVYFGSAACSVCETWDREVGEIYPKTSESKTLPLRHHDVHDDKPDDIAFIKGVIFTPTFVAIEDGREIGRIVGYMGDFFFWEQVDGLIKKLNPVSVQKSAACSDMGDLPSKSPC